MMKERISESILVGRDAYMFLNRESRKQRGCRELSTEQENRLWKRVTRFGEKEKVQVDDNSFGGGDGTYNGKWWAWKVSEIRKILDDAGFTYEKGKEVRYINI